jgi:mitochondrial fission process protein 1
MPWWGNSQASKSEQPKADQPKAGNGESGKAIFDPDKLPDREQLPKALQKIVDKSDNDSSFFDSIVEG